MQPQRSGPFPYVPINRRLRTTWPNGTRLALWIIPNVETFPLNDPVPGGTNPSIADGVSQTVTKRSHLLAIDRTLMSEFVPRRSSGAWSTAPTSLALASPGWQRE